MYRMWCAWFDTFLYQAYTTFTEDTSNAGTHWCNRRYNTPYTLSPNKSIIFHVTCRYKRNKGSFFYILHRLCSSCGRDRIQRRTSGRRTALSHSLLRKRTGKSRENKLNRSWHSLVTLTCMCWGYRCSVIHCSVIIVILIITSCAARWPPQYAPARACQIWRS